MPTSTSPILTQSSTRISSRRNFFNNSFTVSRYSRWTRRLKPVTQAKLAWIFRKILSSVVMPVSKSNQRPYFSVFNLVPSIVVSFTKVKWISYMLILVAQVLKLTQVLYLENYIICLCVILSGKQNYQWAHTF